MSFYRWRQELMSSESWVQRCDDSITRWAAEFTTREFASTSNIDYDSVFDHIQGRLWADVGIDCDWMYGLGESALSYQIGNALLDGIAGIRDEVGHDAFDNLSIDESVNLPTNEPSE